MQNRIELSIVVPVYNNAKSLEELTRRVDVSCGRLVDGYEIILIDDGSLDDSWHVIARLAQDNLRILGLRLSRNFGQHAAIAAGFERAKGDIIVLMDADLEDRPEVISNLLIEIRHGHDIAFTTFAGGDGRPANRMSSRLFHYFTSVLTQSLVPKGVGTLRAFNRKVLNAVLMHSEFNVVYGPLTSTIGFKQAFVSVERDTNFKRSGYTFNKRLRIAVQSLIGFSDYPLILFSVVGMITTLVSLLYAFVVVVQYAVFGSFLLSGQTLLLLVITLSAGFIIFEVGIVGIYVFNIYREVLRRPRYLLMDTTANAKLGFKEE